MLDQPVQAFLAKMQEGRPVISVDIDNTLAFFTSHLLAVINARFGTDYRLKDQKEPGLHFLSGDELAYALEQHSSPDFFATMAPDYAAIASVQAIKDAGYYVIIASSREPEVEKASTKWLDRWHVPYDEVLIGHHVKAKVAAQHSKVMLIDDNPHEVDKLRDGVSLRLLRRAYTGNIMSMGDVEVVDTWAQILNELKIETPTKIPQLNIPPFGWQ